MLFVIFSAVTTMLAASCIDVFIDLAAILRVLNASVSAICLFDMMIPTALLVIGS